MHLAQRRVLPIVGTPAWSLAVVADGDHASAAERIPLGQTGGEKGEEFGQAGRRRHGR